MSQDDAHYQNNLNAPITSVIFFSFLGGHFPYRLSVQVYINIGTGVGKEEKTLPYTYNKVWLSPGPWFRNFAKDRVAQLAALILFMKTRCVFRDIRDKIP